MKLIIAGSRTLGQRLEPTFIEDLIMEMNIGKPDEIVSGGASGIDELGESYAIMVDIRIKHFYPDWNTYDKAAGPIRNKQMAEYADALLLIWDGESKGSKSMRNEMRKLNKPVYEVIINKL